MGKLTFDERLKIFQFLNQGLGIRAIARALHRSPSSICDEIKRQGMDRATFCPLKAQEHADLRKAASTRPSKIEGVLRHLVELLLIEKRFSPEQITHVLARKYPNQQELNACSETIYKFIYRSKEHGLFLRRKRKKRRKRGWSAHRAENWSMKNMQSISQRPQDADDREIVGHWEADLMIGKNLHSAIGTLVERSSRYTIIIPLGNNKDSETVVMKFHEALKGLPQHIKKSLTYDQGIEMKRHEQFTLLSGMPVYFAHKGCPWERGSNENTNGLIREFFPKGTDFTNVKDTEITQIQKLLNQRPRKVLNFKTPEEAMHSFCSRPELMLKEFIRL